ncbi:hypothetical protein B296_00032389 [Ensete ventricosum]|uniref:Uncharacterized protein n=1 Tax=Ensete ventricosum TaxID=4639 RepID=A0A426Z1R5_ENSVE|nr:hypothetical protein B296_00032389 [Ensete ventricosum]
MKEKAGDGMLSPVHVVFPNRCFLYFLRTQRMIDGDVSRVHSYAPPWRAARCKSKSDVRTIKKTHLITALQVSALAGVACKKSQAFGSRSKTETKLPQLGQQSCTVKSPPPSHSPPTITAPWIPTCRCRHNSLACAVVVRVPQRRGQRRTRHCSGPVHCIPPRCASFARAGDRVERMEMENRALRDEVVVGRAEEGVVLRLLLSPRLRPRATPLAQRRRAAPPLVEELQDKESLLRVQLLEQQLLEENVAIIPFLGKEQKLRGSLAPGLTKF